jgi:KaiC/GvpD/RAD55 family RecA-like ATPase
VNTVRREVMGFANDFYIYIRRKKSLKHTMAVFKVEIEHQRIQKETFKLRERERGVLVRRIEVRF